MSEEHVYPQHRILSIYNKHISADHLQLKRDYERLCPHAKIEFKFTEEKSITQLSQIARKRGCDMIAYWETRRHTDLFLYLAAAVGGPTIKFHISCIKASKSMRFEGNFARHTRPILNFTDEFDGNIEMRIAKELLKKVFSIPHLHFKQAPFVDHLFQFAVTEPSLQQFEFHAYQFQFDDKVKVVNKGDDVIVTEAGPQFTVVPVSIYSGCFAGDLVWRNPNYLTQKDVNVQIKNEKEKQKVRCEKEKAWKQKRTEREEGVQDEINQVYSGDTFNQVFK